MVEEIEARRRELGQSQSPASSRLEPRTGLPRASSDPHIRHLHPPRYTRTRGHPSIPEARETQPISSTLQRPTHPRVAAYGHQPYAPTAPIGPLIPGIREPTAALTASGGSLYLGRNFEANARKTRVDAGEMLEVSRR